MVPDALGEGDWFWRVTAIKGDGITSVPSIASKFFVGALSLPALTYPNDTFEQSVEDVVFDWEPVRGAQTYDLQVATDPGFNNFALDVKNVHGTRYSPKVTLNNDEFWWRVRAVDTAGLPTPWTESRFNFKRQWLDQPAAVHPRGTTSSPGRQTLSSIFFEWTPVQHASMYEVEVADDPNFSVNVWSCETPSTTFVPRFVGLDKTDCRIPATMDPSSPIIRYWRVRALDRPYLNTGLPGVFSAPQAFYRDPRPSASGALPTDLATRRGTGLKVAITGYGTRSPGIGCTSSPSIGHPESGTYTSPSVCTGMSTTPVFAWDRQADMDYYLVWFGQDENFTTTRVQPIKTYNTMVALDTRKEPSDVLELPESESGRPYYWYVQPCREGVGCGPRPDSQAVGLTGAAAFQKVSASLQGLTTSDAGGNDIAFSWEDFRASNERTLSYGQAGAQSAKSYHIEIDNEPGFSDPLVDEATVDQTTYTAGDRLYAEGRLYWRVQPVDTHGNRLTWSSIATVTKSSPPVALTSPLGGAAVAGSTPLEWQAQAYASQYTLEVYRNADHSFSAANRMLSVTTRNPSYAPTETLPASATPYVWRVRRLDASGNPGPWSESGSFVSLGAAPELLGPADRSLQAPSRLLFQWSDVPGAATYEFRASSNAGGSLTKTTVASAYAPSEMSDGTWTWSVRAIDASGDLLGVSAARSFVVDATAPKVTKVKPGKPKATSTLVVKFSERVKGVSKTKVQLKLKGAKGKKAKVKAKVKLASTGTKATVNPKGKLKRGKTYILMFKPGITDVAGNALAPVKLDLKVK